jgi:cytochrome bd ubiquinol oxidase subunit II
MNGPEYFLSNAWIGLIAFFVMAYAISDGADLGLGIMCLFTRIEKERGIMIGAIESTWHTNQTWLVIVGGIVFGAFPFFYAVVFSALYIPIMAMIFVLIIRGLALDYYAHARHKALVGWIFAAGSLLVSITQGFALGGLLGGIQIEQNRFAGSMWDWFTPFSGLMAAGVIFGDIVLGAAFLILKGEGELQARGYRYARIFSFALLPVSVGVYVWMCFKYPHMVHKLTHLPDAYWVATTPALAVVAGLLFYFSLWKRYDRMPFFMLSAMILFAFAGISLALYPYLIPNVIGSSVQITNAAASYSTLIFMGIVMAVVVPLIIIYNAYNQFWVFRGKIRSYLEETEEDSK